MVRDESGNLYFAWKFKTLERTGISLKKISPLGQVSQTIQVYGYFSTLNVEVADLDVKGGVVYVCYQIYDDQFNPVQSSIKAYNTSDLSSKWTQSPIMPDFARGVSPNAVNVAVAMANGSATKVKFLDLATGSPGNPYDLVGSTGAISLTSDDAGNAYICLTPPRIAKVNSSGIVYDVPFTFPVHTTAGFYYIALDPVHDAVYAMGQGNYQGSGDYDIIFGGVKASDGSSPVSQYHGGNEDNAPDDLKVSPTGELYAVSATNLAGAILMHLLHLRPNLTVMKDSSLPSVYAGSDMPMAFDNKGNVFVAFSEPLPNFVSAARVAQFDSAGNLVFTVTDTYPRNAAAKCLALDAASNMYIACDASYDDYVARLQAAFLDYSGNNVVGGALVTGTLRLSGPALTGGSQWTLTSNNPALATLPATITIAEGATSKSFTITTKPATANSNVVISAKRGSFVIQKTLTILAAVPAFVTVTPNVVLGGVNSAGAVALTGKAPTGGTQVSLSSNLPSAATVPATVTVPAGAQSIGFTVTTIPVSSNKGVVISATSGGATKTFFMAVNAPSLTAISVNPGTIKGGLTSTLTVFMDAKAPTGGRVILTFSGSPTFLAVPSSVTVAAGNKSVNKTITSFPVTSSVNVLVFATRSGLYKTATVTINP